MARPAVRPGKNDPHPLVVPVDPPTLLLECGTGRRGNAAPRSDVENPSCNRYSSLALAVFSDLDDGGALRRLGSGRLAVVHAELQPGGLAEHGKRSGAWRQRNPADIVVALSGELGGLSLLFWQAIG